MILRPDLWLIIPIGEVPRHVNLSKVSKREQKTSNIIVLWFLQESNYKSDGLKTKVDLGCNFYVQANV